MRYGGYWRALEVPLFRAIRRTHGTSPRDPSSPPRGSRLATGARRMPGWRMALLHCTLIPARGLCGIHGSTTDSSLETQTSDRPLSSPNVHLRSAYCTTVSLRLCALCAMQCKGVHRRCSTSTNHSSMQTTLRHAFQQLPPLFNPSLVRGRAASASD